VPVPPGECHYSMGHIPCQPYYEHRQKPKKSPWQAKGASINPKRKKLIFPANSQSPGES
jgi:hypothetical protein